MERSLYLLVWEKGASGTFFGKNIFGGCGGQIRRSIKRPLLTYARKLDFRDMFLEEYF